MTQKGNGDKCRIDGCGGTLEPMKNKDGTLWAKGWHKCSECRRVQGTTSDGQALVVFARYKEVYYGA